jgi:glutathione S-transferase
MILYSAPPSYYSMIARLALDESPIHFETHYMDIHIAKDQLSPWYTAINPHMTVPSLTDGDLTLTDSRDILNLAAKRAANEWCDSEPLIYPAIEKIVTAHYTISIEELTFGKMMVKHYLLRKLFPHMLGKIIKELEAESKTSANPIATKNKIKVNQQRLAYFTQGDQLKKLQDRKEEVHAYLNQLPKTDNLLFGDKPSSADIVTSVLVGRLNMIGEDELIKSPPMISNWFERMKARPAFAKSDIWLKFKPWRILLKY